MSPNRVRASKLMCRTCGECVRRLPNSTGFAHVFANLFAQAKGRAAKPRPPCAQLVPILAP